MGELNRRLALAPWRGPEDILEGPLLHKLAGQGVGCGESEPIAPNSIRVERANG